MSDHPWPTLRGGQSEFVREHGSERAERFQRAFFEGDPIADALFASGADRAVLMRQLRAALKAGAAGETDAPEVQAFIADMRGALDGADRERLERGRRVYLSIPVLTHSVALGPGSLVNTYSSPAISRVLVSTGRLVEGALRRLLDTRNWTYHLYFRDALVPGAGGFEHTGMVRAMHAFSRAQHLDRSADTSEWGAPINSIDMLRTWFDFTYIPYRGLEKLGYELTPEQTRDVYGFWQVVGRMLGIPADLLAGLDDHEASEPMVRAIGAVAGSPDEGSRALVDALVDATAAQLALVLGLPEGPLRERTQAQVRILHGDELTDQLGIPRVSIQVAEMMAVPVAKQRYDFLRQLPAELETEIATNEAMLAQLLGATEDGRSAYETAPAGETPVEAVA
ncbi:oxygenase MpaB family protein [Brevibacterium daeguense]|uniref:Oxygenase MpaB family protein n=1 Tax=Brevibacterium daeguense TaxID=909936 RepID=A0ABP8EIZ4_9MICO|nr:oxygenase MpaB family protein [Brevibacterium daeguense]